MDRKRMWKYRLVDIAEVTGISLRAVRRLRREGRFDPNDFMSVCGFVAGHALIKRSSVTARSPF